MKKRKIIVACELNRIIGHGRKMPGWNIIDDYKLNFVPKTKGFPCIMGKITAETIMEQLGGPLKNRPCIVVSRNPEKVNLPEGFMVVGSMKKALELAESLPGDTVWNIGGGQIYQLWMEQSLADEIHLTRVKDYFPSKNPGDEIFFPEPPEDKYVLLPFQCERHLKRVPSEKDKGNSNDFNIEVYGKIVTFRPF